VGVNVDEQRHFTLTGFSLAQRTARQAMIQVGVDDEIILRRKIVNRTLFGLSQTLSSDELETCPPVGKLAFGRVSQANNSSLSPARRGKPHFTDKDRQDQTRPALIKPPTAQERWPAAEFKIRLRG
jgi:hypothetical protein